LTSRCCQQAGAWRIVTKVHFARRDDQVDV
jgi:hypothetical protein